MKAKWIATTAACTGISSMAALLPVAPALAQDVRNDPGASVLTRARPELDPLGIRAGTFLIFPAVTAGVAFDDNIFADDNDEEDDFRFSLTPSVTARSQWSRHALTLTADAETAAFLDNNDSDYVDFGVGARGRVDVATSGALNFGLRLGRDHEDRDDPDESGDQDVTKIFTGRLDANYRHRFARFFVQPGIAVNRRDFEDAGNINNDDRDFISYRPSLRVGYALRPGLALFGQGTFDQVIYDETPNDSGVDRDSTGASGTLGVEFDVTGKLIGEVQAGYLFREFDDSQLDDFNGATAQGSLTYNITGLTALIGTVGSQLRETNTTLNGKSASSILASEIGLEIVHELRRNIILDGRASFNRDDFEGINREDDTFRIGAGVDYTLNRNLVLGFDYVFSSRDSDVDGGDFDRNVFWLRLTGRL